MIILLNELLDEESPAAQQAKQMGLTSKGWGRWADASGNITHKTDNGQLVPVQGGEPSQGQPKEKPAQAPPAGGNVQDPKGNKFNFSFDQPKQKAEPAAEPAPTPAAEKPSAVDRIGAVTPSQKDKAKQFARMLKGHDWHYQYADDQRAWRKGTQERQGIEDFVDSSGIDPRLAARLWQRYAPPDLKQNLPKSLVNPSTTTQTTDPKTGKPTGTLRKTTINDPKAYDKATVAGHKAAGEKFKADADARRKNKPTRPSEQPGFKPGGKAITGLGPDAPGDWRAKHVDMDPKTLQRHIDLLDKEIDAIEANGGSIEMLNKRYDALDRALAFQKKQKTQ